ncbi:hypothetical protein HPP92_026050 [Vanilla planifolia]|uniref:peptidylprolyl isomerase n=1 Tax=Vanilla planifolia TaxID=51239 RepID=A0A835PGY6_VANPL|nr:hypothetical protein HPP92_026323 [Vanilla planifolia]KAG0451792.1 hypothetical protein HPP92_026050 [Vanilla planifolia]
MNFATSSFAPSAAVALLRLKPSQEELQNSFFHRGNKPKHKPNPNSKGPNKLPLITTVASHPHRRREASFAIGGLCLATLLYPYTLLFPSAATGVGTPVEPQDCHLTLAPSGLSFCDLVVGSGAGASKGQLIKAHYVGRLENGKVFDSSYGRGKPLTFRVGVGEVIKGWDQGILGGEGIPPMLAGGKRTLKLPPELGYGTRGAGCRGGTCIIPPDSTLLFDVEFLGKA